MSSALAVTVAPSLVTSSPGSWATWNRGRVEVGSLVARANFASTSGAFLINNNAYLEDNAGRCAWGHESITVQPVGLGDDDGDNFPNQEEIHCGSDSKDPASQYYSANLSEAGKAVGRGSEVTFTVILTGISTLKGRSNS